MANPVGNYHQSNKSYERHIDHTPTVMIQTTFFIPVTIETTSTCAGKQAYSIATYLGTVEPKGRVHVAMWQHDIVVTLFQGISISDRCSLLQYRIRLGWAKSTGCFHSLLRNWLRNRVLQQWCCNFCWKGRDRVQSFVLMFTLQLNIFRATFLLVSYSNTFLNLLLSAHGQGQKCSQKLITKKFFRLYNHCLLSTMMFSDTRVNNEKFSLKRSVAKATLSQGLPI